VDPSASGQTIDDAHRRMRSLVPDEVSAELEAMAREVLRSVDEARDILMIPELRAAYEQHLGPRAL
jgi:DnaJ-class molecular chaperone